MSNVSSGIGIVSGLPINDIVNSLVALQQQPISLLTTRIQNLTATRTALLDLSARLLAFKNAAAAFKSADVFSAAKATSSNDSFLRATADLTATVGDYSFTVRQLASSQQLISQNYASATQSNLTAGTLTIESAAGRLNNSTSLSDLRGGQGVRGGTVRITDRSGASADVDLSLARTVQDVVSAINSQSAVHVQARIAGDTLVIDDQTGLSSGNLVVADVGSGHTAADLGLAGSSAAGRLTGNDLVYLANSTRLALLNDGNGVRHGNGGGDLRIATADGSNIDIDLSGRLQPNTALAQLNRGGGVASGSIRVTNRLGQFADVDLTGAASVNDVLTRINAANIGVAAATVDGSIQLTDSTTGTGSLSVAEIGGGTTARDLGLLSSTTSATLRGATVLRIESVGDVLNAINLDLGNKGRVTASLSANGDAIQLTDNSNGGAGLSVTALNNSLAAKDLGLLSSTSGTTLTSGRLLSGLDTVGLENLRGGQGIRVGTFSITDRSGATAQISTSAGQTLTELIDSINKAGTGVTAAVDSTGLGITLTDSSGGSGTLTITDVNGKTAADLGIEYSGTGTTVSSGNLQRRYVSEATRLDQFDNGRGIPPGKFRITNAAGTSAVVDLTQGNEVTLQAVIDEINSRGIGVTARINDNGDGLLLTDTSGGAGQLSVTEEGGGTTARALHILGKAATGTTTLDGSIETKIAVTNSDTLTTLVQKLRDSGAAVNASLIGGGSSSGVRLSLTSARSGLAGQLAFDAGSTGLNFSTLTSGRDSAVQVGSSDSGEPLIITSSSNTVLNAVSGVRLELLAVSNQPVQVSVARDADALSKKLDALATAYNSVLGRIDALSTFDADQGTRGVLLGDRSADEVRSRLNRLINKTVPGQSSQFSRLSSVGFSVKDGQLKFDADKFAGAYAANPDAVSKLFTQDASGLSAAFTAEVDRLTDSTNGSLTLRNQSLTRTADDLDKRKTQLTDLLEARRTRLLAQFQGTEATLARLQSQQSALSSLGAVASAFNLSSLASGS